MSHYAMLFSFVGAVNAKLAAMLSNRSMPGSTVIPVLAYPDLVEAVRWLCDAFGFTVRLQIGEHRAQLNAGDGAVVVTKSDHPAGKGHSIMVRVEDVAAHCELAARYGAKILNQPSDFVYGERQYSVEDPSGRVWTFSQSIADVDPRDWGGIPGQR